MKFKPTKKGMYTMLKILNFILWTMKNELSFGVNVWHDQMCVFKRSIWMDGDLQAGDIKIREIFSEAFAGVKVK